MIFHEKCVYEVNVYMYIYPSEIKQTQGDYIQDILSHLCLTGFFALVFYDIEENMVDNVC